MSAVTTVLINIFTKIGNLSFSSASLFWKYVGRLFVNFFSLVFNWILEKIWVIIKFVLGVMEAFEYMIDEFLGIGKSVDDIIGYARQISVGGISFLNTLVKVFRAVFVVGALLVIIFTIFAIIKQEWVNASKGFTGGGDGKSLAGNKKTGIVLRMFKNLAVMLFIPLIILFVLGGVNAILTSFNNAFKGNTNASVAGKVLASSSYDANKYRRYALENKRIPITITTYNPDDYDDDETQKYIDRIKSNQVQTKLLDIALRMENGDLPSFGDTLLIESGNGNILSRVSTSSEYASIYESFICTPEQYQVMADFIDYAQEANLNYYIKAMDENDIDWQYVEDAVYDKNNNTLTINYTDASDLNGNGSVKDSYQIVYSMSYNVTTPISDALKSLMALLGIGEYGDDTYNIMERDKDFTNVVNWSSEKVLLKFSHNFNINDPRTWTNADEIILYEYNHYSSLNNTLNGYTLDDFAFDGKGVELEAREMHYVEFDPVTGLYKREETETCVFINGRFYRTKKSETERDAYGTLYHVLLEYDDVSFFSSTYRIVETTGNNARLKLQGKSGNAFNMNDRSTWSYADQVLIYEYYRDLSYNNSFGRTVGSFSNLASANGVSVPIYKITSHKDNNDGKSYTETISYYALINDTFYRLVGSNNGTNLSLPSPNEDFLASLDDSVYYTYNFNIDIVNSALYGLSGFESLITTGAVNNGTSLDENSEFNNFVLKFSNGFEYQTPSTWSYRDYFIFYVYLKYLTFTQDLDALKDIGISGKLLKDGSNVYLQFNYKTSSEGAIQTAKIRISNGGAAYISQLNMYYLLDVNSTINSNMIDLNGESLYLDDNGKPSMTAYDFKLFNFSDDFAISDLTNWTMQDLILYGMSASGLIDSINVIEAEGYGARIYNTNSGRMFRFGSKSKAFYLKESSVKALSFSGKSFENINAFFDMKVLDFISMKLNANFSDLVIDADDATFIADNQINHSYTSADVADVTSWTSLDFIFKWLEGRTETLTETSWQFHKNGSSDSYFLIGTYYINITKLGYRFNETTVVSNGASALLSTNIFEQIAEPTDNGSAGKSLTAKEVADNSQLAFSKSFDPSNFNTWTLADFILYYEYTKGTLNYSNFQYFVMDGKVSANNTYGYYLYEDEDTGSTRVYEAFTFVNSGNRSIINYRVFMKLYDVRMRDYARVSSGNRITKEVIYHNSVKPTFNPSTITAQNLTYVYEDKLISNDFIFNDFYYFSYNSENYRKLELEVGQSVINSLESGSGDIVGMIDLRLKSSSSNPFNEWKSKIGNPSQWTITDLIAIIEFADSVDNQRNIYHGLTFKDLAEQENYMPVYYLNGKYYLGINGNYYNLTNFVSEADKSAGKEGPETGIFVLENTLPSGISNLGNVLTKSSISSGSSFNFDFSVLFEQVNMRINPTNSENLRINAKTGADTICLTEPTKNSKTYYTVDTRILDAFVINTNAFSSYSHKLIIREVNWPQKLMNDMMVIYPDLNWETLVANGSWLDTLGEFTSSYASGDFISSGNSANITAAGLVLSEFFLSVSNITFSGYANYEYSPIFDDETIKALMLSMLGEDNYYQLVEQANIFTELFNIAYAPILDQIAKKNSIELGNGKVDNLTISVYKAYLSTVLMSSDYGEYLYKLATRVYAQYTIYDAMAMASGNYAAYQAYLNGEVDADGNPVTFTYSSFYELVKYENTVFTAHAPTFTFNYRNVYQALVNESASDDTIRASLNNENNYKTVLNALIKKYEDIYARGNKISDSDDIYCFMLDVYFSAKYQVEVLQKQSLPEYIENYYDYITGSIIRWDSDISSANIDGASQYIPNTFGYKALLLLYKTVFSGNLLTFYFSGSMNLEDEEGNVTASSIGDTIREMFTFSGNRMALTYVIIADTFEGSNFFSNICDSMGISYVFRDSRLASLDSFMTKFGPIIEILGDLAGCQNDPVKWAKLNEIYNNLGLLVNKLSEVTALSRGDVVDDDHGGTVQKLAVYSDSQYESALSRLESLYNSLENVIETQKILDKITKSSITFTLAQYAENYKTEGFKFDLENMSYTLGSSINPLRLAEYVYGGAFLSQFGVKSVYTSSDFEGLIKTGKKYDSKDGIVKTELITGDKLKKFVTKLADYTAGLYYMTNFNDLSDNVGDYVRLSDIVGSTTPEKAILEYMINNESISIDTWIRLIVGDSDGSGFSNGAKEIIGYINGTVTGLNEATKKSDLISYINDIYSSKRGTYYLENSGNMRVHEMFKNAMSYLLLNEGASAEEAESINLDNITFKEFRKLVMARIVDYVQNESETASDNANRYISLFHLISGEFKYYDADGKFIGRTIDYSVLSYSVDGMTALYKPNAWTTAKQMRLTFNIDKQSQNKVLELAGVANRPIEELVNLEYDHLYDMNGNYDEANGDTFIICTYDYMTGLYTPVLAKSSLDGDGMSDEMSNKYNKYKDATEIELTTDYYSDSSVFPIVAKGALTVNYRPTAIKMVDGNVQFYRTDISATTNVNESAMTAMENISEVSTINYTSFKRITTAQKMGANAESQAMFIGTSGITTFYNFDISVYLLQLNTEYKIELGELGAINVIDNFAVFYLMHMQDYLMLVLGIATIMPILFKASLAVIQRIFDLILLTLLGPWPVAMNSLIVEDDKAKQGSKAYQSWKSMVTQSILAAFGYIVAFNVYFILIKTIAGMTFVSEFTVQKIQNIGGMSFITFSLVNTVVKYLFILLASGTIKATSSMVISIVTTGKVDDAFSSPVSGDVLDNIKQVGQDIRKTFTNVRDVVNGRALIEAKDAAIQSMKQMIPGSAFVEKAIERGKRINNWKKAKDMERQLEMAGLPKHIAKTASQQMRQAKNEQMTIKQQNQLKSANAFQKRIPGAQQFIDIYSKPKKKEKGKSKAKTPKKPKKKKE